MILEKRNRVSAEIYRAGTGSQVRVIVEGEVVNAVIKCNSFKVEMIKKWDEEMNRGAERKQPECRIPE
jgi:hypothetical protein